MAVSITGIEKERDRLEAQRARIEERLQVLAELERLAAKLQDGDGAAGEAPQATAPGPGGASPAAPRPRPEQRKASSHAARQASAATFRAAFQRDRDAILAALAAGPLSPQELEGRTGIARATLTRRLAEMSKSSFVVAHGQTSSRKWMLWDHARNGSANGSANGDGTPQAETGTPAAKASEPRRVPFGERQRTGIVTGRRIA